MVERPTATGPSCWCRRGGAHGVWADVRLGRVWRLSARGVVRRGPTVLVGALRASGDMSSRAGTFDAVGDGNPIPERVGCPRLEPMALGRAECPPPRCLWGRLSSSVDSSRSAGPGAEAAA